ncbi:MAG: hypothetical protein KGM91_23230 [Burkholderiales bacterium]|nr:hypothetical protein [Burkholderiales bacterium]
MKARPLPHHPLDGEAAGNDLEAAEARWWAQVVADRVLSILRPATPIDPERHQQMLDVMFNSRINLGRPVRVPKPAHGPHPRDTQYTIAEDHRKGPRALLIRNPASAAKGRQTKSDEARAARAKIALELTALLGRIAWNAAVSPERLPEDKATSTITRRGLVSEVMRRTGSSRSTVQRELKSLLKKRGRTSGVRLTTFD